MRTDHRLFGQPGETSHPDPSVAGRGFFGNNGANIVPQYEKGTLGGFVVEPNAPEKH